MQDKQASTHSSNDLGTFAGVFTPSILTTLGVIMFMRAGFVVGQAGIFQALLVCALSEHGASSGDEPGAHPR